MESIRKFRHNAMDITAISGFENIKGGINGCCKDVYFVRALGVSPSYLNEIKEMDMALSGLMGNGRGYYRRLNGLPSLQDAEDISFYTDSYSRWEGEGKKEAVTRVTQGNKIWGELLGNACAAVEGIGVQEEMHMSYSMCRNMIVKMLFWFDSVFGKEELVWDERKVWKIAAVNVRKKQEYLFFYLLTLTGCDVLLLQGKEDIGETEEKLGLSAKFVLGDYSEIAIPEYDGDIYRKGSALQGQRNMAAAVPLRAGDMQGKSALPGQEAMPRVTIPPRPERVRRPSLPPGQGNMPRAALPPRSAELSGERAGMAAGWPIPDNLPYGGRHAGSGQDAEKSFEELARLASSVVMITIHDNKGEVIGTGSGIMVGRQGYILTNNHVASGGKYYSVRIEDDDKVYTTDEVIKYNYVLDLAVIRIKRDLIPIPVYRGQKKLVRGQKVVAIGSPLGLFNSVSDGIISGFRKIDNVDMIQFTAPTSRGSSGGAVLNMQGEVIGISTAGFDAGQNINLAMGYECINLFIKGFT